MPLSWRNEAGIHHYDMVIAMGGDGTVHEVINGLMKVPERIRPILGVVPAGSGNDFSHAIGVSKNPAEALRQRAGWRHLPQWILD